jgi:hypothetical protein
VYTSSDCEGTPVFFDALHASCSSGPSTCTRVGSSRFFSQTTCQTYQPGVRTDFYGLLFYPMGPTCQSAEPEEIMAMNPSAGCFAFSADSYARVSCDSDSLALRFYLDSTCNYLGKVQTAKIGCAPNDKGGMTFALCPISDGNLSLILIIVGSALGGIGVVFCGLEI